MNLPIISVQTGEVSRTSKDIEGRTKDRIRILTLLYRSLVEKNLYFLGETRYLEEQNVLREVAPSRHLVRQDTSCPQDLQGARKYIFPLKYLVPTR